ncbi:hypothetical protein AVEN_202964-1 [Araneus ventricosus]|uniref:Uncharacterized protein n=1 Tax=Araneus ventricosus TaxID=182803 RepID=A0A4Y2FXL9_ARAVE|nr:hypothetical protein AVEN_202964-1 [Araneus ventricosus]
MSKDSLSVSVWPTSRRMTRIKIIHCVLDTLSRSVVVVTNPSLPNGKTPSMSPPTLKKSRASKGSVSKVSLDRRRQERMCSGDALATPHFAQTGKSLLPWLKEQLLR